VVVTACLSVYSPARLYQCVSVFFVCSVCSTDWMRSSCSSDGGEGVAMQWLSPASAIEGSVAGTVLLPPPQVRPLIQCIPRH
jgi:hypothetical protein